MSDYFHLLSTMTGTQGHPMLDHDGMGSPLVPITMAAYSPVHHPHSNLGYFQGAYEPVVLDALGPPKSRRRPSQGAGRNTDQKHRRTRSGCFTCRSRRVKCDEARPVCERCRKGSRECIYPEPQVSKCRQKQTAKPKCSENHQASPSPTPGDEHYDGTIDDEEQAWQDISWQGPADRGCRRTSTASSIMDPPTGRQCSETPSQDGRSSLSSSSTLTTGSWTPLERQAPEMMRYMCPGESFDWSDLASASRRYLDFFAEHMTNYHYSLIVDDGGFFRAVLPKLALQCEPLLNAVVAFSAYHAALRDSNGRLEEFLHFYNKSVTQLLQIIDRKEMHSVHALVTILQLATIEEYLGDWVNLRGHQKAAFEIITQIFCPQTVTQSPVGRMCMAWYARFDTTLALMGGLPMDLHREWLLAMLQFYQSDADRQSIQPPVALEERYAHLQLILHDISSLYARRERGEISSPDYAIEHEQLSMQLQTWSDGCDQALSGPGFLVSDSLWKQTADPSQSVHYWPFDQDSLVDHGLLNHTILTAQWHSIVMMHRSQSQNLHSEDVFEELSQNAYAICQHFAFLEHWPSAPAGALIAVQQCMSIAAIVLPHSENNNAWLKGKFALIESLGHILPKVHRAKMAEAFHDPSCTDWWLPNGEGFTPVLQYLRSFADERNARPATAQQANLREMTHFLGRLGLDGRRCSDGIEQCDRL